MIILTGALGVPPDAVSPPGKDKYCTRLRIRRTWPWYGDNDWWAVVDPP